MKEGQEKITFYGDLQTGTITRYEEYLVAEEGGESYWQAGAPVQLNGDEVPALMAGTIFFGALHPQALFQGHTVEVVGSYSLTYSRPKITKILRIRLLLADGSEYPASSHEVELI